MVSLKVSNQVGNLMDLYLTMLDMAGLPRPKGVVFDGISLLPTMLNGTTQDRFVSMDSRTSLLLYYGHPLDELRQCRVNKIINI